MSIKGYSVVVSLVSPYKDKRENFKSENKTTLNIEQNIINEINNTITKLTTNSEKIVETKLEKVVKEIHHQNKVDLSEAVMMMKKIINEEKFENNNNFNKIN